MRHRPGRITGKVASFQDRPPGIGYRLVSRVVLRPGRLHEVIGGSHNPRSNLAAGGRPVIEVSLGAVALLAIGGDVEQSARDRRAIGKDTTVGFPLPMPNVSVCAILICYNSTAPDPLCCNRPRKSAPARPSRPPGSFLRVARRTVTERFPSRRKIGTSRSG